MLRIVLIALLLFSPALATAATCPCAASCSCGCQDGGPCNCDLKWVKVEGSNEYALYKGRVQIGSYCADRRIYRPIEGDRWGEPCECPVAIPGKLPFPREVAEQNFGLDRDGLSRDKSYSINGKRATRKEVADALSKVPDDAGKNRLTVIGPDADRKQVMDDLAKNPALVSLKDRLVITEYPPDHWAVARAGFVTSGKPTIYLQKPDGTVLHRQDSYEGGAAKLATAIRKVDPSYDPAKDPDATKNLDLSFLGKVPPMAWLLGGIGILFFLNRSKS